MCLTAIYTLCYNFSVDLNDPFTGVIQIKRSSTTSYLLQVKWLIQNQPYGRDVRFDNPTSLKDEDNDVGTIVKEEGERVAAELEQLRVGNNDVNTTSLSSSSSLSSSMEDDTKKNINERWKNVIRAEMEKNRGGITEEMIDDLLPSNTGRYDRKTLLRRKRRRKR